MVLRGLRYLEKRVVLKRVKDGGLLWNNQYISNPICLHCASYFYKNLQSKVFIEHGSVFRYSCVIVRQGELTIWKVKGPVTEP